MESASIPLFGLAGSRDCSRNLFSLSTVEKKGVGMKTCKTCGAELTTRSQKEFCSGHCAKQAQKAARVFWHCDNPGCREDFILTHTQSVKYRQKERKGLLAGQRFYCCRDCAIENGALVRQINDSCKFSLAALETYWKKVEDLTYYQGLRYSVATPLSYQDRGVKIARSTKART